MKNSKKVLMTAVIAIVLLLLMSITASATERVHQEHHFNDLEQAIYDELSTYIVEVANGTRTSTQFTIQSDLSDLSYTKSEIGCTISSNGSITSAAKSALGEKIKEDIDFSYIYSSLKKDFPYEFFWHGSYWSYNYSCRGNTSSIWVTSLTISIHVSKDYRLISTNKYRVSPSEIARGNAAAENAKAIVAKYADKSDLDKLTAYRNEIWALSYYNNEAADDDNYPYGDPWNLVYVFDGDPDTKVVCEGFSKAFKYLCDLSTFDKDIVCYIVTGDNHMWNVVSINGFNYLTDITARSGYYFLVGGLSSEGGKVHTLTYGKYTYYDSRDDYLILSETDYHEHTFRTYWYFDGAEHWHQCSCGERTDVTSHASSGKHQATCTRQAVCDVCSTAYGDLAPHVYDQQVKTNKYVKSNATCQSKAVYYYSCVCGKVGTETFEGEYGKHVYNVQNTDEQYLKIPATCTQRAWYYYSCSCGEAHPLNVFPTGTIKPHTINDAGECTECDYKRPVSESETEEDKSQQSIPNTTPGSANSSTTNSSDQNTQETPIMSSESSPTSLGELIAELIIWFFKLLLGIE